MACAPSPACQPGLIILQRNSHPSYLTPFLLHSPSSNRTVPRPVHFLTWVSSSLPFHPCPITLIYSPVSKMVSWPLTLPPLPTLLQHCKFCKPQIFPCLLKTPQEVLLRPKPGCLGPRYKNLNNLLPTCFSNWPLAPHTCASIRNLEAPNPPHPSCS